MKHWSFHFPTTVHSGPGSLERVHPWIEEKNVLLVTSQGMLKRRTAEKLMRSSPSVRWLIMTAEPNPDIHALDAKAGEFRDEQVEAIVGFGGGSALDSAKAMAVILGQDSSWSLVEYLQGRVRSIQRVLPLFCIPTTAGTGAEVTPFGTMWDKSARKKYSLASPLLYPKAVFLEPELTLSLPALETLVGGLDTLSHALETLWGTRANPASLVLARESLRMAIDWLPRVLEDGASLEARTGMQAASMIAGMALSQSRTAVAHVMSYPLTLSFGVPHGLACAFALPALIALTGRKRSWRSSDDERLANEAAAVMNDLDMPSLMGGYGATGDTCSLLEENFIPEWADHFVPGLSREEFIAVVRESLGG